MQIMPFELVAPTGVVCCVQKQRCKCLKECYRSKLLPLRLLMCKQRFLPDALRGILSHSAQHPARSQQSGNMWLANSTSWISRLVAEDTNLYLCTLPVVHQRLGLEWRRQRICRWREQESCCVADNFISIWCNALLSSLATGTADLSLSSQQGQSMVCVLTVQPPSGSVYLKPQLKPSFQSCRYHTDLPRRSSLIP